MASSNIISASKLNKDNLTFVVGTAKAGRSAPINIKYEGQNFTIRLPAKVQLPGGLWERTDQKTGVTAYSLSIPLKGCDPYAQERNTDGSDTASMYNFLLDLENSIIQQAFENSSKWFGKKRSMEALRDSFTKLVSVSVDTVNAEKVPNGKYPPSFRVKLPVWDNNVKSDIVDGNGNPMYATPESLKTIFPKGISASLVVSGSIYTIAGGSFGVTWKLDFAKVYPQTKVTAKDVFKDEEDEEDPSEETEAPTEAQVTAVEAPVTEEVTQEEEPVQEKPASRRKKATAT